MRSDVYIHSVAIGIIVSIATNTLSYALLTDIDDLHVAVRGEFDAV